LGKINTDTVLLRGKNTPQVWCSMVGRYLKGTELLSEEQEIQEREGIKTPCFENL